MTEDLEEILAQMETPEHLLALSLLKSTWPPDRPDDLCQCTHPESEHNANRLCIAFPGVLGCGCLGFRKKEER